MSDLHDMLTQAGEISRQNFGRKLTIFLPGMITAYGRKGRYPAVSLTGKRCEQNCRHCAGKLLDTMLPAETPEDLVALGQKLWAKGRQGILLSGGSDAKGRLPWLEMLPAIREIKQSTGLTLTAHVGRLDAAMARELKRAGVSQALLDIVGDYDTARDILGQPDWLRLQKQTLDSCAEAGLDIAPHLILGLNKGRLRGEEKALEFLAPYHPGVIVFVVFMPLSGTPMADVEPLPATDAARFLARARLAFPGVRHNLGCARPRGKYRAELDALAVEAGINALAIPSDGALKAADKLGLEVTYRDTCCSVSL